MNSVSEAGKGDTYRPIDKDKFDKHYGTIFGPRCVVCSKPIINSAFVRSSDGLVHNECWYKHNLLDIINHIKDILNNCEDESELRSSLNSFITHIQGDLL